MKKRCLEPYIAVVVSPRKKMTQLVKFEDCGGRSNYSETVIVHLLRSVERQRNRDQETGRQRDRRIATVIQKHEAVTRLHVFSLPS